MPSRRAQRDAHGMWTASCATAVHVSTAVRSCLSTRDAADMIIMTAYGISAFDREGQLRRLGVRDRRHVKRQTRYVCTRPHYELLNAILRARWLLR